MPSIGTAYTHNGINAPTDQHSKSLGNIPGRQPEPSPTGLQRSKSLPNISGFNQRSSVPQQPGLHDMFTEVLQNHIVPHLPPRSRIALADTSKKLAGQLAPVKRNMKELNEKLDETLDNFLNNQESMSEAEQRTVVDQFLAGTRSLPDRPRTAKLEMLAMTHIFLPIRAEVGKGLLTEASRLGDHHLCANVLATLAPRVHADVRVPDNENSELFHGILDQAKGLAPKPQARVLTHLAASIASLSRSDETSANTTKGIDALLDALIDLRDAKDPDVDLKSVVGEMQLPYRIGRYAPETEGQRLSTKLSTLLRAQ